MLNNLDGYTQIFINVILLILKQLNVTSTINSPKLQGYA